MNNFAFSASNLKLPSKDLVILKEPASSTGTLSTLQNLEKELSFTYQFFVEKQQEEEPGKTNTEAEVQSMVLVPIHQDTSSVPPMTTLVIDLTTSQSGSPLPTQTATTLAAMQAPLRVHFNDLSAVDMTKILQQRMFEDKSYETHEDHKKLYDVLEKSLGRDYSDQLLSDLEEARKKKRKRRTSGSAQQQGSEALCSSKSAASTSQSMAWTTSDSRYKSAGISKTQELTPIDSLIQDDSIPDKQVHFSDDEDSENDHLQKTYSRKDWWKPLPEEERSATPKPAWTIPCFTTGDMTNFLNWYCRQVNKTALTPANIKGQAYEVLKSFYPDVIHLYPLGHVTIKTQFFFNKDLEYLRYGSKGSSPILSISKMKAASYPNFGLELLVPEQISSILTDMLLCHVKKKSNQTCGFLMSSELKPTQDMGMTTLAKLSFGELFSKNIRLPKKISITYFQLDIESYQTQLNLTKPRWDATCYEFKHDYTTIESPQAVVFPVNNNERKIMRFNEIYKFSDDTLTRILEALAYRVKEFKIRWLNTVGFNPLVHSFHALSTLRGFGLRMASAAVKPCQGDSLEVYLITGEKCEHAGPKVTTSHGGNTSQQE
nr:hypothetical protein [Tanacetum cinerariifolium]